MTRNPPPANCNMVTKDEQIMPMANATIPYWRTQLHYLDEYRSTLELPVECDIAIGEYEVD